MLKFHDTITKSCVVINCIGEKSKRVHKECQIIIRTKILENLNSERNSNKQDIPKIKLTTTEKAENLRN